MSEYSDSESVISCGLAGLSVTSAGLGVSLSGFPLAAQMASAAAAMATPTLSDLIYIKTLDGWL
ncbi:hypothetical protein [Cypionkella sp. TWP1-2-1b2]|uniref:hypothetical protein n=1 Tax=Cypionkella sp. TWP1-2-1b2 TaxID=2804675 RepID=UPI003CF54C29